MMEEPRFFALDEVMEQRYLEQLQDASSNGWTVPEPFPSHDPLIRLIRDHLNFMAGQVDNHGRGRGDCVCDSCVAYAWLPSHLKAIEAILQLHDKVVVDEYQTYEGPLEEVVLCEGCGQDVEQGPCREIEALAASLGIEWDGEL